MNLDFEVRKAVALWCYEVSLEDVGVANHAARVAIARNLSAATFPAGAADPYLPNIVGYIRTFYGEEASSEQITEGVGLTLTMFVALGVLQG